MRLIVVNSNSSGNSYALDADNEILLLEAGCKMADVKKKIGFRLSSIVGCCVTHRHGDHAKYATEYSKFGVKVYGPKDIEENKQFPYDKFVALKPDKKISLGRFIVIPFVNFHDVPTYGYLIYHPTCGTILFSTDSYKLENTIKGVNHFLIEANYSDEIIKENLMRGVIDKSQVDRIMLSHMSLEYCIKYLKDCEADKAQTITLCHLSERNSSTDKFRDAVASELGVPTYIAYKGLVVNLNKV